MLGMPPDRSLAQVTSDLTDPDCCVLIIALGTTRYVPAENVPYLASTQSEPEPVVAPDISSVGPENPILPLNDLWSACWDDEAGAVYYYNQETGEATWIPPPV
jgi:hypothetical protein